MLCAATCTVDSDCSAKDFCDLDAGCSPKLKDMRLCERDAQCKSGACRSVGQSLGPECRSCRIAHTLTCSSLQL
jgi:hypothetical protein